MTKSAEATRLQKATQKLNMIFKENEEYFIASFHNLLWQILVNGSLDKEMCVFHPVVTEGGLWEVVLANIQGGYNHTGCYFKPGTTYNEACDRLDILNVDVFGLELEAAAKVMDKSMKLGRS